MTESKDTRYTLDQVLATMEFFERYGEIWKREFGADFFTRDHWYMFNECCRSFWKGRDFTISDAIRTMPLLAATVARTRIEEAEKAGYVRIVNSNRDARTKHVLPSDELELKVKAVFEGAVDLLRETLLDLQDKGRLPRTTPPPGRN